MPLYVNDGKDPLDAAGLDEAAHDLLDHDGLTGIPAAADGETESVTTGAGASINRVVPGGTLAVDGESMEFEVWGTTASDGSVVTVDFAGGTILTLTGISTTAPFWIRGVLVRTGATTAEFVVNSNQIQTGTGNQFVSVGGRAWTWANALTLLVSATGSGPVLRGLVIRKWAA